MKDKLLIVITCLTALLFLAGCKEGGSGLSFNFGGSSAGTNSAANNSLNNSSAPAGTTDSGSSDINLAHSPEPATIALLGSGLFAYVLLRRRKK